MSTVASALVCTAKFVESIATWPHCSDIDSNFVLYPTPLSVFQFHPKCNQFIFWWYWLHARISSKSIQYLCEANKKVPMLAQDRHRDVRRNMLATTACGDIKSKMQKK